MSRKLAVVLFGLLFALLLQCWLVRGTYELDYTINLRADGSAVWMIEQRGTSIELSFDRLVENATSLMQTVEAKTQRDMGLSNFSLSVNYSGPYETAVYQFCWSNFSEVQGSQISVGDVFNVEDFFAYLYGDGNVRLTYPPEWVVSSVSPMPQEQAPSSLDWYGIEEFGPGEPKVVLEQKSSAPGFLGFVGNNEILVIGLLAIASAGASSFYYLRFKRPKRKGARQEMPSAQVALRMEDDEEKVVDLLRASGGSLYQSTIADQCKFSRAKASKLLRAMEERGIIRREQKGREKVVTVLNKSKGDR